MELGRAAATRDHALELAPRLRQSDRAEILAASGMDPEESLVKGVEQSRRTEAWLLDGRVVAITGVADSDRPNYGIIWMLASDEADLIHKKLLRGNREHVSELLQGYRMVFNFVDERNSKAQRWLAWLGFTFGSPQPHGVSGLPFRPFWLFNLGDPCVSRHDTTRCAQRV